jgi:hypothetical protein
MMALGLNAIRARINHMEKEFNLNKVQVNYTTKRDKDNNILDRSTMINIRTDSVDEAYQLFSNLRQRLNGQLDSGSIKQGEISYQSEGETCPQCGKNLVERKGKNGDSFFGCSGFKDGCRFTKTL